MTDLGSAAVENTVAETPRPRRPLFDDNFVAGFEADGPGARWGIRPVGDRPRGDGRVTTSADGLVVAPEAVHAVTGLPAFAPFPDDSGHLRWAALSTVVSSAGFPGFDAGGGELVLEAEVGFEAFGLDGHPYGDDVTAPGADLRLATGALITVDRETGLVFDFMLTATQVWAVYERLPLAGSGHGAFTFSVPVGGRTPDGTHRCGVAYRSSEGVVTWRLDGHEVLRVDRIGLALPDRYLTKTDGGPAVAAWPRQLNVGFGLMAERLYGQGARLAVRRVGVTLQ